MRTNDEALLKIKYNVLHEVAKLAFSGELDEKRDEIPFKLIPGPKAQFRCCVYKEREIIRQRVRLAEGKCPSGKHSDNMIQVIPSACEECPITRFVVTDNCQKCMGKACQNACNFGAISIGRDRAHIDPDKCKECGKCAQACPYNAIAEPSLPPRMSCGRHHHGSGYGYLPDRREEMHPVRSLREELSLRSHHLQGVYRPGHQRP